MNSDKFHTFISALNCLCREHGVLITGAESFGLEVWDLTSTDEGPLYFSIIADHTTYFDRGWNVG